jgi:hypothetical protein
LMRYFGKSVVPYGRKFCTKQGGEEEIEGALPGTGRQGGTDTPIQQDALAHLLAHSATAQSPHTS